MTRKIKVAALQASFGLDLGANIARVAELVREAAARGAQVILPPELFQGPYFCVAQEERWFKEAHPWREHPCVRALAPLAAELGVVLPISIFEREGPHYFNSLVVADADGALLGLYRKSHIPDGPGYMEKYYFRPGDTGFKVWHTRFGRLGVGICWDQWYPEAARAMALMGAEVLLYPTAIGSEPHDPTLNTAAPWRRAMQGHAVSNVIPVVGANRIAMRTFGSPQVWGTIGEGPRKKLGYLSFGAYEEDIGGFAARLSDLGIARIDPPPGIESRSLSGSEVQRCSST